MLGLRDKVEDWLAEDPKLATSGGAHGIPVAFHAAMSGDIRVMELLWAHGAQEEVRKSLMGAVWKNRSEMVSWLLSHQADTTVVNFENKSALEIAQEYGFDEIAALLIAAQS